MTADTAAAALRHDALLYAGEEQFLAGAMPFIRAGLEAGDHVLVVLDEDKNALVQSELAGDARGVEFGDMRDVGVNPARLIPAWRQYIDARRDSGRAIRGLGEPIWAGRSAAALVECGRHEALVNVAFGDVPGLQLLCPYEADALPDDVLAEAHRSHSMIVECGTRRSSMAFTGGAAGAPAFDDPLPEPRAPVRDLIFEASELAGVRRLVAGRARAVGLDAVRSEDFVLAVNEIATNSVRHGGGRGTVRIWQERGALICEVRDAGQLDDPLAGRRRPLTADPGGRGLWLANQVCDLVQLRSSAHGTAVRLHMCTH